MKRRGLSVVEIALSFTVVLLAALPLLTLISGTHRRAHDVSANFKEAVLGQLVLEALKARVELNPCFVRELTRAYGFVEQEWTLASGDSVKAQVLTASVWDEEPAIVDTAGRPVSAGLFTQYLFNHGGGGLYSATNARSLSPGNSTLLSAKELDSLRGNYRGLTYRVVLCDGPLLRIGRSGVERPIPRRDFTRQIRVEVFSAAQSGVMPAQPAFAFETVIETPEESLTAASILERQADRTENNFAYERAQAFFAVSWAAPSGVPGEVISALADLSVMFGEVVGESLNSDGDDLGFNVGTNPKSIKSWIETLSGTGSVFGKQQSAELAERRALLVMDALHRTRDPIRKLFAATDDVTRRGLNLLARLDGRIDARSPAPAQPLPANQALIDETLEFLKIPLFWITFFENASYRRALERPPLWGGRLSEALEQAAKLREELNADTRATPLESLRNLRAYVDLTRALKLSAGRSIPQEQLIATTRRASLDSMMPFSEWLAQDDVNDLPALTVRYPRFVASARELQLLFEDTGNYRRMLYNIRVAFPQLVTQLTGKLNELGQAARLSELTTRTKAQVADGLKEKMAVTPPAGTPTGALALRDIFQRSLEASTPAAIAALQTELLALNRGKALTDRVEAALAEAVQESLEARLEKLTAPDVSGIVGPAGLPASLQRRAGS